MINFLYNVFINVAAGFVVGFAKKITYYAIAKIKNKKKNDVPPKDHRS
jgi:hypothetical protein